jgi:hypothetical protein
MLCTIVRRFSNIRILYDFQNETVEWLVQVFYKIVARKTVTTTHWSLSSKSFQSKRIKREGYWVQKRNLVYQSCASCGSASDSNSVSVPKTQSATSFYKVSPVASNAEVTFVTFIGY